jgi:hypothetical protein
VQQFDNLTIQQNKNAFSSARREMKAFTNPIENSPIGWPHPSLCGEAPRNAGADECNQTGILTSASILTPAFPSFRSVALGVCSRYSGATVPDSHRVPRHLTVMVGGSCSAGFKERGMDMLKIKSCQVII